MATKKTVKPQDLTPREGKVLRFLVGRKHNGDSQTYTDDCIVEATWSDLPHSHNQAVQTVSSLKVKGLLTNVAKGQYTPTEAGIKLIVAANKAGMWNAPPAPSVTNNPVHIDPVIKPYQKADTQPAKPKAKPKAKAKPRAKASK